jgi:hypothetical protein
MITIEQFLALMLAGGVGGLISSLVNALKARSDAKRDDRKQKVDEQVSNVNGAKTLVDAAEKVVKLQDDQAAELLKKIDGLGLDLKNVREQASLERGRAELELSKVQLRLVDAENRLARAERRAGEAEKQANEFRTDVIRIGEELVQERKSNDEKITELKRDNQATINKLVVIIESLFKRLKDAGIEPEDFNLEDLKRMYVIEKAPA